MAQGKFLEEIMFELKLKVSKTFIRAAVLTVWSLGPWGSMRKTYKHQRALFTFY